jgi:hypothetical protein
MKNSLTLTGTIVSSKLSEGLVELAVDVGQDLSLTFRFFVHHKNKAVADAGLCLLKRICSAIGDHNVDDTSGFIGHKIKVVVVQPSVCNGMVQPLVVVDVGMP